MCLRVLWIVAPVGHEDGAVTTERNPRCSIARLRHENIAKLDQRLAVPLSAGEADCSLVSIQGLRIREIDEMVLRKTRVQRDIHQAMNRTRIAGPAGIF